MLGGGCPRSGAGVPPVGLRLGGCRAVLPRPGLTRAFRRRAPSWRVRSRPPPGRRSVTTASWGGGRAVG